MTDGPRRRQVKVENATILLRVPKDRTSTLKKEIRHRLDSESHDDYKGYVHYVEDDYETVEISHGDWLEVLAYYVDCTIRMSADSAEHNAASTARWVLSTPTAVMGVGYMEVAENEIVEIEE